MPADLILSQGKAQTWAVLGTCLSREVLGSGLELDYEEREGWSSGKIKENVNNSTESSWGPWTSGLTMCGGWCRKSGVLKGASSQNNSAELLTLCQSGEVTGPQPHNPGLPPPGPGLFQSPHSGWIGCAWGTPDRFSRARALSCLLREARRQPTILGQVLSRAVRSLGTLREKEVHVEVFLTDRKEQVETAASVCRRHASSLPDESRPTAQNHAP